MGKDEKVRTNEILFHLLKARRLVSGTGVIKPKCTRLQNWVNGESRWQFESERFSRLVPYLKRYPGTLVRVRRRLFPESCWAIGQQADWSWCVAKPVETKSDCERKSQSELVVEKSRQVSDEFCDGRFLDISIGFRGLLIRNLLLLDEILVRG